MEPKAGPNCEHKLDPETANGEFEQSVTKRSATLKAELKANLETK